MVPAAGGDLTLAEVAAVARGDAPVEVAPAACAATSVLLNQLAGAPR